MTDYQPDILAFLEKIVQKNTIAYTEDFNIDRIMLQASARESNLEQRSFLWLSRPHGTWCVPEREAFLRDSSAYHTWMFYANQPKGIMAYRVVVSGFRDGKLAGKVVPLDYAKQVQRVVKSALPIAKVQYSIVETRGKDCYCILCHAIDVAIEHQPNMPKMQVICNEVRIRTGKRTNEAVSRALNRAAKDIWQNGRRRELRAYWIEEPPTAKELIALISAKLWADRQN